MIALRDYQAVTVERLRGLIRQGRRRILLVAPCGAGKGAIISHCTGQWAATGARVLVLSHRLELVDDLHARIRGEGVRAGVMMGQHPAADPGARVQVASPQTLVRRRPLSPPPDYIIADEAHHSVSPTHRKVIDAYPGAVLIGPTASPWRTDGKGLGELYEEVVVATTTRQLIDRGFLSDFTGYRFATPDLSGVRVRHGDYDERALGAVMSGSAVVGDVVQEWIDHAGNARTVAFACNLQHSRRLVEDFRKAGAAAVHVDGETPAAERRAAVEALRDGRIRVLSNVGILTEGIDVPGIECVVLARPTLSLGLALQMLGRGMRPSPGKDRLRIHDHAGILARHGLPDAERDYSLTADVGKPCKDAPPADVRVCRKCRAVYELGVDACPDCGAPWQTPRELREVQGEAVALDEERGVSDTELPDARRDEFRALLAEQREPGWASAEFRRRHGVFPHWRWLRG